MRRWLAFRVLGQHPMFLLIAGSGVGQYKEIAKLGRRQRAWLATLGHSPVVPSPESCDRARRSITALRCRLQARSLWATVRKRGARC
jgi:hypothetical protein